MAIVPYMQGQLLRDDLKQTLGGAADVSSAATGVWLNIANGDAPPVYLFVNYTPPCGCLAVAILECGYYHTVANAQIMFRIHENNTATDLGGNIEYEDGASYHNSIKPIIGTMALTANTPYEFRAQAVNNTAGTLTFKRDTLFTQLMILPFANT